MAIIENTLKNGNGDNVKMYIEVDDEQLPVVTRASDAPGATRSVFTPLDQAADAFTNAMGLIETCASQVSSTVKAIPQEARPKEFEIQFAIKLDATFGAILAKATGEAQLQVTLVWGEVIS